MKNIFLSLFCFLVLASGFCYPQNSGSLEKIDRLLDSCLYKEAIAMLEAQEPALRETRQLARLYFLNGDPKKAIQIYQYIKDKNWRDFIYLGLAFEEEGDSKAAIGSYFNSLKLKENGLALYRLAKIFYKKSDFIQARDYFLKVVSFDSSIRLAHYYLGMIFFMSRDYHNSYVHFNKAAIFYPANKNIKKRLKSAEKNLGKDFFLAERKKKEEKRRAVLLPAYVFEGGPLLKVGIATGLDSFTFRTAGSSSVSDAKNTAVLSPGKFYTISLENKKFILREQQTSRLLQKLSAPLRITSKGYPVYIFDIATGKGHFWHKEIDRAYRGEINVLLTKDAITLVNVLAVDDYLFGVVPCEIPPRYGIEALKAQAIAARTLVFKNMARHKKEGFNLCSEVHCQVYSGFLSENPRTNTAVRETKGLIMLFHGEPIEAFYHSNCGGCLRSSFYGKREYLVNKVDAAEELTLSDRDEWFTGSPGVFCSRGEHESNFRWQRIYDEDDFKLIFGYSLKEVEAISLRRRECFDCYDMEVLTKRNKIVLSGEFKIRDYFDKLRSSAFIAELKHSAAGQAKLMIFWGAGFGHGAGLCQEGAAEMATKGYSYKDILSHYYPGSAIEKKY